MRLFLTAVACLALAGCVAPLMMAPAMLSSAMPAMTMMGASTAARSAVTRQQQPTDGTAPKLQVPWAKKTGEAATSPSGR